MRPFVTTLNGWASNDQKACSDSICSTVILVCGNFAAGGRMNTDDREVLLEYSAPRSLLVRGLDDENLRELYETQAKS